MHGKVSSFSPTGPGCSRRNQSMATSGCSYGARRLSDLLKEQQEPFVVAPHRRSPFLEAYKTTARKALLLQWDDLVAGCFTCGARRRQSFRRPPRAGDVVGDSPVSVLELHSDGESTVLSHCEPSTSGAAAKPCSTFVVTSGKVRAAEAEGNDDSKRLQRKSGSLVVEEADQATLVALDLSAGSARDQWRRVVAGGEEEVWRVGQSIEAIIFEEVRWEAVRDIFCLPLPA